MTGCESAYSKKSSKAEVETSPSLRASLARYTAALADDVVVYPGHGPSTTIGHEKKTNPFLTGAARLIRR